jgi:hypothetical protein
MVSTNQAIEVRTSYFARRFAGTAARAPFITED